MALQQLDELFASDELSFSDARRLAGPAFAGTDKSPGEPFVTFALGSFDHQSLDPSFPDFFMGFAVGRAIRRGGKAYCIRRDDKKAVGMIVVQEWDAAKENSIPFGWIRNMWGDTRDYIRMAREDGSQPVLMSDRKYRSHRDRLFRVIERTDKLREGIHNQHGPANKHLFIHIVAVNPDYQGQGIGREMLEKINQVSDKQQIPLYLEAAGEKNLEIYQKFGFESVASFQIADHDDESNVVEAHGMIRWPKKSST